MGFGPCVGSSLEFLQATTAELDLAGLSGVLSRWGHQMTPSESWFHCPKFFAQGYHTALARLPPNVCLQSQPVPISILSPIRFICLFPLFAILETWGRFLPFPPALTAKCWHLARQRGSLTCVHGKEGPDTSAGVICRETPLPAGIIEVTPRERHFQIL